MSNEEHQDTNSTSNTSSISNSINNGNGNGNCNDNSNKLINDGGLPIASGAAIAESSSGTYRSSSSTDNEAAALLHIPNGSSVTATTNVTDASKSRDRVSTSISIAADTVTAVINPNKNSTSSAIVVVEDPIEATATATAVEGIQNPLPQPQPLQVTQTQAQAQLQAAVSHSIEPQAAAAAAPHPAPAPTPTPAPAPATTYLHSYPPIHPQPHIHPQAQTVTVHTPAAITADTPIAPVPAQAPVPAPPAIVTANANVPKRNSPVVLSISHTKWNRNGFGQNIEPKTGKYSAIESQAVRKAIEDYCTSQNVSSSRLCSESDNRTDHLRGAWMEISKALPNRTVQSIYRHGLRLMHPFKRGAWSEEETNELLTLVNRFGKKWAEIQTRLNRSADSCRDKYREFHTDYTKGKWTDEESEQLMTYVKESLKVGPETTLEQLKHMFMDHEQQQQQQQQNGNGNSHTSSHGCIPWMAISARMKIRSRLGCFKRFQQMTGIKSEQNQKRKRRKVVHQTQTQTQTQTPPQNNGAQPVTVQAVQKVPGGPVPVPVPVLIDGKGQTLEQGKTQGRMMDSNRMGVKIVPNGNGNGSIGMSRMDPINTTGVVIESATAAAAQTTNAETSSRVIDNTLAGLSPAATAPIRVGVSSRTNMTPNPITALDALAPVGAPHAHAHTHTQTQTHQLPLTGGIMKRNCMDSSLPVPTDTQPDMSSVSVSVSVPDPTNTEANDHLDILATAADTDADANADADTDPYYDRQLLQTLAASSFSREADVEWTTIRHPLADARGRWQEMLETYIESNDDVDEGQLLAMPVAHISKMILEYQDQAEMAARTVDDVLLV